MVVYPPARQLAKGGEIELVVWGGYADVINNASRFFGLINRYSCGGCGGFWVSGWLEAKAGCSCGEARLPFCGLGKP